MTCVYLSHLTVSFVPRCAFVPPGCVICLAECVFVPLLGKNIRKEYIRKINLRKSLSKPATFGRRLKNFSLRETGRPWPKVPLVGMYAQEVVV